MKWPFTKRSLLGAATIATLVMFPLINALNVEHGYWLHWRTQDTAETLGAWVLLLAIVWTTIWTPTRYASVRVSEGAYALWLSVGGFFFFGALVKTESLHDFATRHRVASPAIAVALGLLFSTLACLVWVRAQRWGGVPFERLTLTLSPLVLLFLFQLGNAQRHHLAPKVERAPHSGLRTTSPGYSGTRLRTLVLLFDELSPDYLYGSETAGLERLPALRRLVEDSHVFPGAYLPGGATRGAIPALFMNGQPEDLSTQGGASRRSDDPPASLARGWLGRAVERGLDVRVFGWYLDYCSGIALAASECRAVSLYNFRTLDDGVSLAHPFWTTLNLLPADTPFGFAKRQVAVRLHRATYAAALAWTRAQLEDDAADVVYVHVNVPHVPFIAGDFIGLDRFVMTPDRYRRQLQYVDAFVADALDALAKIMVGRPTQLIVMSDHNVRPLTPAGAHEEVVFMVRSPNSSGGGQHRGRVNAADLLSGLVLQGN